MESSAFEGISMRKYLVITSLFTLALVAGCQSGPPTYYGPCSQLAQDAGACTGPATSAARSIRLSGADRASGNPRIRLARAKR